MSDGTIAKPTRLERALEVRDYALAIIKRYGGWNIDASNVRMLESTHGGFNISYRTPFTKLPPPSAKFVKQVLLCGMPPGANFAQLNLPYGLDIWPSGRTKVMNLEWDGKGKVKVVNFKPGEWQNELRALASKLEVAA